MAFDPFEDRLRLQAAAFLNPCEYRFHQILVLDRFACGSLPPILTPIYIPQCDAIDGISTVRHYSYISILGYRVKSSQYCSKFGTLICLLGARQSLR